MIVRGPSNSFEADIVTAVVRTASKTGSHDTTQTNSIKPRLLDPTLDTPGGYMNVFKIDGIDGLVFKTSKMDRNRFRDFASEALRVHVVGNELIGNPSLVDVEGFPLTKIPGFAAVSYVKTPGVDEGVVVQEFGDKSDLRAGETEELYDRLIAYGVHTDCVQPKNSAVVYSSGQREVVNIDNHDVRIDNPHDWIQHFGVVSMLDKLENDDFNF